MCQNPPALTDLTEFAKDPKPLRQSAGIRARQSLGTTYLSLVSKTPEQLEADGKENCCLKTLNGLSKGPYKGRASCT